MAAATYTITTIQPTMATTAAIASTAAVSTTAKPFRYTIATTTMYQQPMTPAPQIYSTLSTANAHVPTNVCTTNEQCGCSECQQVKPKFLCACTLVSIYRLVAWLFLAQRWLLFLLYYVGLPVGLDNAEPFALGTYFASSQSGCECER